ncbi:hypothetical protein [Chryseobacterium shandongense]|uniref:hypothetical protein n=1 Tax=Chryseobacterium shandongense TaxID=1493872 RepID=UPI000F50C034|nr:hypothetical protein [Chryseobacterium shandongense]
MEIIKKTFSTEFYREFHNSIFAEFGNFNDAIIGVTVDRRVVYNYHHLHNFFKRRYRSYENSFLNRNIFLDFISDKLQEYDSQLKKEFSVTAPIFCMDLEFINVTLPHLKENQITTFKENN